MLTTTFQALEGYKTYILSVLGILIAVAGHFWGPFSVGSFQIPQFSSGDMWNVIWHSSVFSAIRHGVSSSN